MIDGLGDSVLKRITYEYPTGPLLDLAWNSTNNKVYCANFGGVTIIDSETDSVMTSIFLGVGFRNLIWNSINNKIYCANYDSAGVIIIDGANDSLITTIPVGNGPAAFA